MSTYEVPKILDTWLPQTHINALIVAIVSYTSVQTISKSPKGIGGSRLLILDRMGAVGEHSSCLGSRCARCCPVQRQQGCQHISENMVNSCREEVCKDSTARAPSPKGDNAAVTRV